jgi:hypothetical protein
MPVLLAGATSGVTTVQATDAVTATITLPSVTTTLVGAATPSFTTTIGVGGATASASGAGITFPATQSASTNANTLDDYEEGTWTPSLLFGGNSVGMTYTTRTGTYTKIGNVVTLTVSIDINAIGSSTGSATITGLPFASPSGNASNAAATFAGWSLPGGSVTAPMAASYGSTLYLNHQPSGSAPTALTKTQFGSTSTYVFLTT